MATTDLFGLAMLLYGDRPVNHLSRDFHGPICRQIMTTPYARNLYLVPRGTFKTSLITITANIQRILRDQNIRILIASNKADAAEAMLAELKQHLQNPLLIAAFPEILYEDPQRQADTWTRSAVSVKRTRIIREPTVSTIGVEGETTGRHYDHGTFDDIVGLQNSATREMLLTTISWARVSVSLFDPGATIDYVGTPWHYADYWGWLREQKRLGRIELGTYITPCWLSVEEGTPGAEYCADFGWVKTTFPERFPLPELLKIRQEKGPSEFAAQYLLNPVSADTAIFPRQKILPFIHPARHRPDINTLWICCTVDPAISTKKWADYSVVAVGGFDSVGDLHLLSLKRARMGEGELVNEVYETFGRFPSMTVIGLEAIGFAKIYQTLFSAAGDRRGYHLPITKLPRDTNTAKSIRIRSLEPYWNNGQLHLYEDLHSLDAFIDEAIRFRVDRENVHDDMLDAVSDLLQLRARPHGKKTETDKIIEKAALDDPQMLRKLRKEHGIARHRSAAKLSPLDPASMRAAVSMALRQEEQDAARQRAMAMVGAGRDEFWHSG